MKNKVMFIENRLYICTATPSRNEYHNSFTAFKHTPRSIVNYEFFSFFAGVATLTPRFFYFNFYEMQHPVNIETNVKYSSVQFTPNPAKTDISKAITDLFNWYGPEEIQEELLFLYGAFMQSKDFQDTSDSRRADILFMINQLILFVHKLEKLS